MTESEHLNRAELQDLQAERLKGLLAQLVPANPFWTRKFHEAGVEVATVQSVQDLARLPLTTKTEVADDHLRHPPYGSNLTYPLTAYSRMHQTSGTTGGPMRWLDTPASWNWFMECWAQIYRLVGLRREDRLFFPFSFGPFIGFWAAFEGANRLGNLCLPGGGLTSQARLRMIEENQATVVCCTPTYALRLAEVAAEEGIDLAAGPVRALIVAGEPGGSIPATRSRIETAWGARVFDHWGMTEIGSLAVESDEEPLVRGSDNPVRRIDPTDRIVRPTGSLQVLETECIAEILDPATSEPVEPGELGELVITNLGRVGSPLIRYRTGDLVKEEVRSQKSEVRNPNAEAGCVAGSSFILHPSSFGPLRLEGGILGRVDDMVTIRGNNVFPSSIEAVLRRFDDVAEYRITVFTERSMQHLKIEIEPTPAAASSPTADELVDQVSRAVKNVLNFHAEVVPVPPGSLPRFELKGRRFVKS